MYVSYQLDFGSYDSRHGFQIVDNDNEQILWTEWVVDGYILVGTTRDIYKIYSTFAEDSNGVISISIQGMGLTQPPISSAVIKWGTFIVYLSSEGWKYIAGSVVENFSQQLDLLYRGFSRQGLNALQTPVGNIPVYSCAQSHNHLYASVVDTAGNNVLHIYNFNKKTWVKMY